MRNLKKILALVLALMMVLSVMVTASAAFGDDADIDHKEAVDVMVAAKILSGDGNGNFRPADALERSAAAKLIAYLVLGEDIQYVEQTETVFTDVPATHWASGFIGFANEAGIVVGNNGEFNPDGAINGYSFAKMVILALAKLSGADEVEFIKYLDPTAKMGNDGEWTVAPFTGNYTLKVRLAISTLADLGVNLLTDLDGVSLNANLTREHAAQMVFNVLNQTGILEDTYKLAKNEEYEDAGLAGYVWYSTETGKDVTAPVITDTLVGSFTAGTTFADVMKALGVTEKSTIAGVNYYNTAEGEAVKPADFVKSTDIVPVTTTLDVYKTADGKTLKFMYTIETLATASVAKNAETKGDYAGLYKWTFGSAYTYAAKDAYTDKGVYVVVANGTELIAEPVLAEIVTGKIMAKGANYVYVNGAIYVVLSEIPALDETGEKEYDLYMTTDGTVLAIEEAGEAPVVVTGETLVYVVDNYSLFVKGTPAVPAEKDKYGVEIEGTGKPAVADRTDLYVQGINVDGEEVNYLVAQEYEAYTLYAVTVNPETGVATLTAPATSKVVSADNLEETGVKFVIDGKNYYVSGAEYVKVSGAKSTLKVAAGTRADAAAATNGYAFFTGDPTKTNNLTVTKVIYFDGSAPVVPEVEADRGMYAVAGTSTDSMLIETLNADEETVLKTIWAHTVMIDGVWTTVYTYDATLAVAGPATYTVDEYGIYTIEADALQAIEHVENVYGDLITFDDYFAEFVDMDMTGITVIDLSTKNDGTLDVNDMVNYTFAYNETTEKFEIVTAYIIDWTAYDTTTAQYAIDNAREGAYIYLLPGEYETLSVASDKLTIVGYEGAVVAGLQVGAVDGLTVKNVAFVDARLEVCYDNNLSKNVSIIGCSFTNAHVFQNGNYVPVENLVVDSCIFEGSYVDPAGRSEGWTAIIIKNANGVTVKNCEIYDVTFNAIQIGTSGAGFAGDTVITGNKIIGTGDRVLRFGTPADEEATLTITNNTVVSEGDVNGELIKATAEVEATMSGNSWNGETDADSAELFINVTIK